MPSVQDTAIVLRLTEFSETSQVVTLLTRATGCVRLLAKGTRRSTKTRFEPGLDLLELGDVHFATAKGDAGLGSLHEWWQRDGFAGLRRDVTRIYAALYACEAIVALTVEEDPAPQLFDATQHLLTALCANTPPATAITTFQAALFDAAGLAPEMRACVFCDRRRSTGRSAAFTAAGGGLVCRQCQHRARDQRRLPAAMLDDPDAHAPDWFALYDYHVTYTHRRPLRTSAALARRLGATPLSAPAGERGE